MFKVHCIKKHMLWTEKRTIWLQLRGLMKSTLSGFCKTIDGRTASDVQIRPVVAYQQSSRLWYPPTLGWRVGHLGGLISPLSLEIGAGGWATAGTERRYPEPFGLLEPPAQNPGCCCVVGQPYSSGAFFWFFVFLAVFPPKTSGPPRPPCPPSKFVLLTVLDLCLCCLTRVSCCGHPSIH